jgi:DnaK suppressor protein
MRKSLLEKYKGRLAQEQEELRALMSRRGQDIRANDGVVPEDSAEQAANAYSKEFVFHQTDSERVRLALVSKALKRIESLEFGSCESCGESIEPKRLDAVPWARYCRACQEVEEQRDSLPEGSDFINEMA